MDGEGEGAIHPYVVSNWFELREYTKIGRFCAMHSRKCVLQTQEVIDYAIEKFSEPPLSLDFSNFKSWAVISRLGVADKLAIVYTPIWMYCREEMDEYIRNEKNVHINSFVGRKDRIREWKQVVDKKCLEFVEEWKDKAYDIQQY